MSIRKTALIGLLLCLLILLCGCRTRTAGIGQNPPAESGEGVTDTARRGESAADDAPDPAEAETAADSGEAGSRTRENPDAPRKEYDENAPAEIVPGTDRLLHGEGEGSGAPLVNAEAQLRADRLDEQAEDTASQTVAAEEAEQMGVGEDAEEADSALTYFTVLLQDRMGSLFECQRLNVYWETAEDHVTIHKTAPEHSLILNAGCYDVSSRLLEENLRVDDGWVVRKNPGVIVKIVDGSVLGSGAGGTGAAEAVRKQLVNREGWSDIDAVKNGRVLLLAGELLEAPHLQAAAMLLIARTAHPELFPDVDPEKMLSMLTEEQTGTLPTGIYFYCKEQGT